MTFFSTRRGFTVGITCLLAATAVPAFAMTSSTIEGIEQSRGGRLGVFALDTGTGRTLEYRADERFLLQSTFKGFLAAMILARIDAGRDNLSDFISFGKKNLVPASPVTSAQVAAGRMTIEDLCKAILERSDNTAANLLLKHVGGPASLTSYVHSLGDTVTRFDRYEPVGGWFGIKDTTTPRSIVDLARTVVLGDVLKSESQALLGRWMAANVVGQVRLRASFPPSWTAGDRTGTGDGICNDYAVARPPGRAPLVMSAYYEAPGMEMGAQEAVLREVGSAIVAWFS